MHTHTDTHRHVCVWCDAGCCGDQWESMLCPHTETIKREWIMRLFIDWSICNQGILLRRSWDFFFLLLSLSSFCPLLLPPYCVISLLQASETSHFSLFYLISFWTLIYYTTLSFSFLYYTFSDAKRRWIIGCFLQKSSHSHKHANQCHAAVMLSGAIQGHSWETQWRTMHDIMLW